MKYLEHALLGDALRVLHLITKLPVGGAERLVVDIVRKLPAPGYESLVCCIQERGELAAEVEAAGVRVVCLDRMRSKRFDWGAVRDLARLLAAEHIDLVHSHLYHANLYGRLAALRAGVPAIASVHNTYTRTKLHRRLLNRLLARKTARVIAVSNEIRADLVRHDGIPPDKIVTIANGIDVERVQSALSRAQARERLGLPEQAFALGCVARLEEQKGHRYLFEALALLRRDAPEIAGRLRLVVVGEGRLRNKLEALSKTLGLEAIIEFLGTRRDVADILKALDLYVMPSMWEGLSLALLEAMAAGLPVVASDVGGVSQVLEGGEYGIKLRPGDPAALATAIRTLAEEPAERRRGRGDRARERVREHFSVEAMMRRLTALYTEALR